MRERSIHCQRIGCRKSTFNDHGYCCDRCKLSASAPSWTDADRDPLSVDGERVPISDPTVSVALRGGVTFGQVQASPAAVPAP